MTDSSSGARWRIANLVLAGATALALVVLVVIAAAGTSVLPGTSPANRSAKDYDAAATTARQGMDAFLTVDYRNMDKLQAALLDLSTGAFKSQYAAAEVNIKASTQAARVIAKPTIREVGVSQLAEGKATAVVSADLVRSNKATVKQPATKTCPHAGATCLYFRFTVQLTKTAEGWKLSGVEPVS